jgi:hypothetical protein
VHEARITSSLCPDPAPVSTAKSPRNIPEHKRGNLPETASTNQDAAHQTRTASCRGFPRLPRRSVQLPGIAGMRMNPNINGLAICRRWRPPIPGGLSNCRGFSGGLSLISGARKKVCPFVGTRIIGLGHGRSKEWLLNQF